jgi:LysR family glycine cleavage system transcriptional activator
MQRLQRYHLNGLRALEAAGRLGSLQRAADELGVSPGAVSQHIIRAEQQLGRPVFARTPHGLAATPFGERLLARLTTGFRTLDDAVALAENSGDRALTVSVAPVLASKWLVPRLAGFRKLHPDIRVRIEATTDIVDFALSDVDLALRIGAGKWPGVRLRKLMAHHIFPVCSPAIARALATPADLRHQPVVFDANAPGFWSSWLKPHGMTEDDLLPGDSFTDAALCVEAAIASQGVMMGWQTLAADAIAAGLLVAPFPERADTGNSYFAASSADRTLGGREKVFIDWVENEMEKTAKSFT